MYHNITFTSQEKQEKGASLITTFFILTIILAVVLSISILLYGQIKIIRNIGNSVVAFYAADSGVEKVLYYDRKQIPVGGIRGLCNIGIICPNCTPGVDCVESKCQGWSATGSDCATTCGDCVVSFNSFFDDKSYNAKISITTDGELSAISIDSRGNYKDVSRKIQLLIGNGAVTPPPPLLSVFTFTSPNPANVNQAVTFFATPSGGTGSYSYAWTGDCTATSQNCVKSFPTSGDYTATVTVISGTQTASGSAVVTVNLAPSITTQPANQTVNSGQTASFSVTASGTSPLTYQWQKSIDGGTIWNNVGTNSSSYTTPPTVFGDNGTKFKAVVTNSAGSETSNDAKLTVIPTITISDAGGNWSATGTWVGGVVPTSADNVVATATSGNVTIDAAASARSVDLTGYVGTLTHNSAITLSIGDGTAGAGNIALKFVSGMTYTLVSVTTSAISFISTSTTVQTVDFAGKISGNVTYNGVAGSWQMTGTHNTGSTATVTLTNGTLNTNGQTMSIGIFNSSNSNTRTLTLGASAISSANGTTPWNLGTTTGLTFTANTAGITLSGSGITFSGGGLTYGGTLSLTGASSAVIAGANTFANLIRTGTATKTNQLSLSANQTVTGTLTLAGNSAVNRVLVASDTVGTARTITSTGATMTWSNVDFRDITLGTGTPFDASVITGGSGNAGGNTNITFTTAQTNYWIGGAGSWSTAGEWSTTSGGAANGRVPLPQDDAVFNTNSFSAGGLTVTQDMPRAGKNINWTGVTNTPTFTTSTAASVFGSLTLVSGMTLTASTQTYTFEGRGSFTLTNAGKTWAKSIILNAPSGTLTLQDAYTNGATITTTVTNGTFNANNFGFTTGLFSSTNSNTRVITMGSGTWTLTGTGTVWTTATATGLTLNGNTSTIKITNTSNTANTFQGGGRTFNNIWWSRGVSTATNTIVGANTYADFRDDGTAAHTIVFPNSTSTFTTFTVSGSSGNLITLVRTGASGTFTLSKLGGGTICRDFLSISNSTANPATTWYAGANSTNGGANTGWTFTACP